GGQVERVPQVAGADLRQLGRHALVLRRAQRLVELDARHLLDVGPDPRGLLPELGQELGVDAARHHDALGLALAQGLEDGVAAVDEHLREYTYAPAGRDAAARAAP